MGKINRLILKIVLGIFVATNFVACIVTTDLRILGPLNLLLAVVCFGVFRLIDRNVSGLSRDLGISREAARVLIGDYFAYYKNVEKISIDEYLKRSSI
jgi:hypothetical protein